MANVEETVNIWLALSMFSRVPFSGSQAQHMAIVHIDLQFIYAIPFELKRVHWSKLILHTSVKSEVGCNFMSVLVRFS
jgi:hypothetical protein